MSSNGANGSRHRSPVYPADDLKTAVGRLEQFWDANSTHSVNVDVAIQGWGYSPKSSTGKRSVAALIHYGLLEDEGSGSDREVWVSELGKDIVVPPNDRARREALEKAALNPRVYEKLWNRFGVDLPARAQVKRTLLDWGFNESVIDSIVDDYESTIEYSGLRESTTGASEPGDTEDGPAGEETAPTERGTADSGGEADDGEEEKAMPSTKASSEKRDEDLPIWLPGGMRAILRVPVPMSEEQFEHLKEALPSHLDLQKEGMTYSTEE